MLANIVFYPFVLLLVGTYAKETKTNRSAFFDIGS